MTAPNKATDDPCNGAYDSLIAELAAAHPRATYVELAVALAAAGIDVTAQYVAQRLEALR